MSLTATVTAALSGNYQKPKGLGTSNYDYALSIVKQWTNGVLAGQVDLLYQTALGGKVMVPSTNDDIDLTGATLDALGDATAMVKVKGVLLYNHSDSINTLTVGNATNPFVGWFGSGSMTEGVPPDGVLLHTHPGVGAVAGGWSVVAATGDIFRVANGATNTATYDLMIIGTSA